MTSTPPVDPRHRPRRSLTSRTSLLTAVAIAGVLVAGTAAVAANIGILNAADNSTIGELTATDGLLPDLAADAGIPTSAAGEAPLPPSTTVTARADDSVQQYDIAGTGAVWVMTTSSGLTLDHVVAAPGWTAALSQGDLRSLQVEFTNVERTVVFTASLGDDGTVVVDVTEPTTVLAPATEAALTPSAATRHDDEHHDDHDDEEHDEYEGAEDDD